MCLSDTEAAATKEEDGEDSDKSKGTFVFGPPVPFALRVFVPLRSGAVGVSVLLPGLALSPLFWELPKPAILPEAAGPLMLSLETAEPLMLLLEAPVLLATTNPSALEGLDGLEASDWLERPEAEGLERLEELERAEGPDGLEGLEGLERLEGLEGLEGLEELEGVEGVEGLEGLDGVVRLE